jgi:hypothetical protein
VTSTPSAPRRIALLVGSATVFVLACAGPASADIPEGWSHPKPVPVLHDLLFLIGVPILVTLAIFAAIYLPGVLRGESVAPAGAKAEDQWFGGRRDTAQLQAGPTGADSDASHGGRETGGASGSW